MSEYPSDSASELSPDQQVGSEAVSLGAEAKRPGLFVIICGLATTLIALVLVYVLQGLEIPTMGFYLFFIVPVGAILIGLLAGSGYAVGSWMMGAKLGGGLLLLVLALQVTAYFSAQYLEYNQSVARFNESKADFILQATQDAGSDFDEETAEEFWGAMKRASGLSSFPAYFDSRTRNFVFENKNGPGNPLGFWGYGVRLLEIGGFCLGSLIGPLILMAAPYCSECQTYKKTANIGMLPAGVKPRKVKKKDVEGLATYQQELDDAVNGGLQLVEETAEMAKTGNSKEFTDLLGQMKESRKEINKQTSRINVIMIYCPKCHDGELKYQMVTGQGEEMVTRDISTHEVDPTFVRETMMSV